MTKKESKKKPISATEEEPMRNLIMLLLLIPIAPILLIYYFVTGKNQNSFILGSGLTIILTAITIFGLLKYAETEERISPELNSMVEELSFEEQKDLSEEFSTLKESIGEEKFPVELNPVLGVEQNMLVINYYNYLINTGQIGKSGEGAILVLQNSLYSRDKTLVRAAWEALKNIGTKESKFVMQKFIKDVKEYKELQEKQRKKMIGKKLPEDGDMEYYKQKFKNKINIIKNSF